ncbi:MAG: DUF1552 domain-containing protein [Alphaproteobacteria bacterium]|nr:DUF1552 domain-containing protein [Alphaproteobacteria bacterium]
MSRWTRRRVLRGFLGGGLVTVGLPWLEVFAGRSARAACETGFPQRFGTFFWGNGNLPFRWTPTGEGEGEAWALSEQLQPLAALKDHITVVTGYAIKVPNISPHWSGAAGLLTGRALTGDDSSWAVAAPTLDQLLAAELGNETLYRSLEIGVDTDAVYSWSGPDARNFGETDPYTLYERLFGETFREPGGEGQVDPTLGYRRSALDAVMTDIADLQSELGASDRVRLEQHLDGVRDLELRLARLEEDPPELDSCVRPDAPSASWPDVDGRPDIIGRSRALADLLAMALACDQTRIFTFQFTKPLSNALLAGASDGHHNLTHNEGGEQAEVHDITLAIMAEFGYLLEALRAIPEGDETLLDHCMVLGTTEVSEGRTHSLDEVPLVLAGGGCGRIRMGVHHRTYSQESVGKVMLSVQRAMGLNAADWGDGDTYVTDGVSEIEP